MPGVGTSGRGLIPRRTPPQPLPVRGEGACLFQEDVPLPRAGEQSTSRRIRLPPRARGGVASSLWTATSQKSLKDDRRPRHLARIRPMKCFADLVQRERVRDHLIPRILRARPLHELQRLLQMLGLVVHHAVHRAIAEDQPRRVQLIGQPGADIADLESSRRCAPPCAGLRYTPADDRRPRRRCRRPSPRSAPAPA